MLYLNIIINFFNALLLVGYVLSYLCCNSTLFVADTFLSLFKELENMLTNGLDTKFGKLRCGKETCIALYLKKEQQHLLVFSLVFQINFQAIFMPSAEIFKQSAWAMR